MRKGGELGFLRDAYDTIPEDDKKTPEGHFLRFAGQELYNLIVGRLAPTMTRALRRTYIEGEAFRNAATDEALTDENVGAVLDSAYRVAWEGARTIFHKRQKSAREDWRKLFIFLGSSTQDPEIRQWIYYSGAFGREVYEGVLVPMDTVSRYCVTQYFVHSTPISKIVKLIPDADEKGVRAHIAQGLAQITNNLKDTIAMGDKGQEFIRQLAQYTRTEPVCGEPNCLLRQQAYGGTDLQHYYMATKYIQGWSMTQISEATGEPVSVVINNLSRFMSNVQQTMALDAAQRHKDGECSCD